jgi:hypothetical protein
MHNALKIKDHERHLNFFDSEDKELFCHFSQVFDDFRLQKVLRLNCDLSINRKIVSKNVVEN